MKERQPERVERTSAGNLPGPDGNYADSEDTLRSLESAPLLHYSCRASFAQMMQGKLLI